MSGHRESPVWALRRQGRGDDATPVTAEAAPGAAPLASRRVRTVLVIDDDPAVRRLVTDVLEAYGYAAVTAADGFEGLRAVARERPDCVVLDVMMPGLDGHDVLTRLRASEEGARIPVVMLTAAADDDDHAWRAWTEGVDYFLAKPFEPDELLGFLSYLESV